MIADPELIARTVLACPAVDALDAGGIGGPSTYLPGRRIDGVSVSDRTVTLQLRMRWGTSVTALRSQVRAAVRPLAGGRDIDITVADVALPPGLSEGNDGRPGIPPTSA